LLRLVAHAASNVPFYKERFERAGVDPGEIRTEDDLARLPVLTKAEIRSRPVGDLLARGLKPSRLLRVTTTGSTGEPFTVYVSKSDELARCVLRRRVMADYGLRLRDRMARLWIHPPNQRPLPWRLAQRLGLYRQEIIPQLDPPTAIADRLLATRPDVVAGNVVVLARAGEVLSSRRARRGWRPRFVVAGHEAMTPGLRRRIRESFAARVFDSYECQEAGVIAWECPREGGYHVCDDGVILEILRADGTPAGEGEEGEAVITPLHGSAMPLLRFRLGDVVRRGPAVCPCGSPFSTLTAVSGRLTDFLVLPAGRELFASALAAPVHEQAGWVERYELVQERTESVVLRARVFRPPSETELASLTEKSRALLGRDVAFRVELVPDFPDEPGRKFRVLRSLVGPQASK